MGPHTVQTRGPQRILLVDDIELNRVLTQAVLTSASYEVDCVSNGAAAVRAVEAKTYDLVLMDLDMPDVDGHQAAAEIRRKNGPAAPQVVALTSRNSANERARSLDVGMESHLGRPIAPQDLLRAVKDFLAPVFRPDIQDEIVTRLGVVRTRVFLAALLNHCDDALRAVSTGSGDLDRMAHDLASTSGMLGYEDLSHRCRDLLVAPDEVTRAKTLAPLQVSLKRAITILREQTGQVEAAA